MEFASYIAGFVDGEGTFCVSFNYRARLNTKIEVRPSFSISQHKRNLEILKRIKAYFGVGSIRFSKRDQNYKYEVRSLKDLLKRVIPHFENFPLRTTKQKDFEFFREICFSMKENRHLNRDCLKDIIEKAYQMNESGQRRYKKKQLLRFMTR